ncbi:MAG: MucB/RseB C-terminal domain-containing protein [Gallionella sp.]|nr:MucB/RseB C-terminal domain-containing protein [Gallionella sp.]MDD4958501.1 MucB/RseB C-terminal domain-containing protein [Gallionella sp.]
MRLVVALFGVLYVHTVLLAAEDPASQAWLKTMAFAKHQTDYSGVFVHEYDRHIEKIKISHLVTAEGEYEKLTLLDGTNREVIRHHGLSWWYGNHQNQQENSAQKFGRFPVLLSAQVDSLNKNYLMEPAGSEKVAGFDTQVIVFKPKDNYRYMQKMWVHSDSGLLLKSVIVNDKNRIVEKYAFTELQIGGKIDRSWVAPPQQEKSFNLTPAESAVPERPFKSGWVVDALPTGFNKIKEIQRPMTGKHAPVTQMVYSDGLSSISVFVEPCDQDDDDNENLTDRGALHLYHKVVKNHLFTVVGEVPVRTVIKVLDSIRYNGR